MEATGEGADLENGGHRGSGGGVPTLPGLVRRPSCAGGAIRRARPHGVPYTAACATSRSMNAITSIGVAGSDTPPSDAGTRSTSVRSRVVFRKPCPS
jgi:hypothetical protein